MALEDTIGQIKEQWQQTTDRLSDNKMYRRTVDVLSGWLYYTPTYAAQELAMGKDLETVAKTRLIGLAAHAVSMSTIGKLRNYAAKKYGVTTESPWTDKLKVNLIAVTPVQAVVYAGMLVAGMAWSGQYDWKASLYAWGVGVTLGAVHSFPYGFVQDKVRTFFGVRPAIGCKPEVEGEIEKKIGEGY